MRVTMRSNWSLEWTSASLPRYAACIFSAPRGQLAPATQLKRNGQITTALFEVDGQVRRCL